MSVAEYRQRAEMHEQLASSTGDLAARKMHLAMATEYRRKAAEMEASHAASSIRPDPILKVVA
jgi:hypothetical protein